MTASSAKGAQRERQGCGHDHILSFACRTKRQPSCLHQYGCSAYYHYFKGVGEGSLKLADRDSAPVCLPVEGAPPGAGLASVGAR